MKMDNNHEPTKFCWRSSWFNPSESLWFALRKFSFFNEVNMKHLQSVFGAGIVRSYLWGSRKRLDLREYGGLDPPLLAAVLGVDKNVLDSSTAIPFLAEGERPALWSDQLRFCYSCLDEGFHSSLHQIILITQCPLHGELLTERCRHCGTSVDYSLKTVAFASSGGCPNCISWVGTNQEIRQRFTLSSTEREGKFRAATEFLKCRLELRKREYSVAWWLTNHRNTRTRERLSAVIAGYWRDVVDGEPNRLTPSESYKFFDYRVRPGGDKHSIAEDNSDRPYAFRAEFDRELTGILKSIRRQLDKLWLGPHKNCANLLMRRKRIFAFTQNGKPCPYANVLLLWRLYWEDLTELHHLLGRYRARTNSGIIRPINWMEDMSLPRELLHRLFAMECLALLEECCLLVKVPRRRNEHTFCQSFLTEVRGRRMPYWILERRSDGVLRLHVWKQTLARKSWRKIAFAGVPPPQAEMTTAVPHSLANLVGKFGSSKRLARVGEFASHDLA
jgi:hypothetical protein